MLTLILRFERLQPIAAAEVVEVEKRKYKKKKIINAVLRFDGLRWTQNASAEICKKLYSQSRSMELLLNSTL